MSANPGPCEAPEASQFDFWLGDWDLAWPAEQTGGRQGETSVGTNRVERLFGPCVVAEHFSTDDAAFAGRSWSVFDPATRQWRQTWVDSRGGYLLLSGGYDGEIMELRTAESDRDGERVVNRMLFRDIEADSFGWVWQRSSASGTTWIDLWTIAYRRQM